MARPQRLNETQLAELFDPPTEQRDLVRHFTLSETDLGAIRRCRGSSSKGRALVGVHVLCLTFMRSGGMEKVARDWRKTCQEGKRT